MVFTGAVRGGWSRRAVLAMVGTGAIGALTGCSLLDRQPPPPPPPDPLEPVLATARTLAARYQAAAAAHPDLAERLTPLREAHLAHAAELLAVIARPELATPSAGAGMWAPPTADEPADPDQLRETLREAEQAGEREAGQACLAAPPERAALLGSIAAARACHVEVLS